MKIRIPDEANVHSYADLTKGKEYFVKEISGFLATIDDDVDDEIMVICKQDDDDKTCGFLKNKHAWEVVKTEEAEETH